MLLVPTVSAAGVFTLSATEPKNLNYTYSINIPLEYSISNASDCWVILEGTKYYENMSLTCTDTSAAFDVDYDGNYTAQYWAHNGSDKLNVNKSFIIDRTSEFEDGKATILVIIVAALIIIGFYSLHFASKLAAHFQALMSTMSFLFIYSSLAIILLIAREYIKVPAIFSNLETMFTVTVYAAMLIGMLILLYFIFGTIYNHFDVMKQRRLGNPSPPDSHNFYK